MKLTTLSIGTKHPAWMNEGFATYAKRFRHPWQLELIEIPLPKRKPSLSIERTQSLESDNLLSHIKPSSLTIALDEHGKHMTSLQLSDKLKYWQNSTSQINFLIGGPDGLHNTCLEKADFIWSLSPLTFAHGLARIVLAEQLYRSWTLLNNHPYHRE